MTVPVPAGAGGVDREAIRARCEAATPGPWQSIPTVHGDPHVQTGEPLSDDGTAVVVAGHPRTRRVAVWTSPSDYGRADAEFIAHAREDVPDLLAALAAAEQRAEAAERALDANAYEQVAEFVREDWRARAVAAEQRADTAEAESAERDHRAYEHGKEIGRALMMGRVKRAKQRIDTLAAAIESARDLCSRHCLPLESEPTDAQ